MVSTRRHSYQPDAATAAGSAATTPGRRTRHSSLSSVGNDCSQAADSPRPRTRASSVPPRTETDVPSSPHVGVKTRRSSGILDSPAPSLHDRRSLPAAAMAASQGMPRSRAHRKSLLARFREGGGDDEALPPLLEREDGIEEENVEDGGVGGKRTQKVTGGQKVVGVQEEKTETSEQVMSEERVVAPADGSSDKVVVLSEKPATMLEVAMPVLQAVTSGKLNLEEKMHGDSERSSDKPYEASSDVAASTALSAAAASPEKDSAPTDKVALSADVGDIAEAMDAETAGDAETAEDAETTDDAETTVCLETADDAETIDIEMGQEMDLQSVDAVDSSDPGTVAGQVNTATANGRQSPEEVENTLPDVTDTPTSTTLGDTRDDSHVKYSVIPSPEKPPKQVSAGAICSEKLASIQQILSDVTTPSAPSSASAPCPDLVHVSNTITLVTVPRGLPKSGRFWKPVRTKCSSVLVCDRDPYTVRMQKRHQLQAVKRLEKKLKDERKQKQQELQKRREYNAKRTAENALKAEVYQVVKNPNKIKRMKKKQLRQLQKRDTTVVGRSVLEE